MPIKKVKDNLERNRGFSLLNLILFTHFEFISKLADFCSHQAKANAKAKTKILFDLFRLSIDLFRFSVRFRLV